MFVADRIDFPVNEQKQFERIKQEMFAQLSDDKEKYYVVIDHIIGNQQYDIIVLKRDAIISIELKGYKGEIIGTENGTWYGDQGDENLVEIKQKKNPYEQARTQRYRLLDFLNEKLPNVSARFKDTRIYNATAVLCFENGSTYDMSQINEKKNPWFHVTDEGNLVDLIRTVSSREFVLKNVELNAMLSEMNLLKLDVKQKTKKLEVSSKNLLSSEDFTLIAQRLVELYGTSSFTLNDLARIVDAEVAARFLKEGLEKKTLERFEGTNQFHLAENWSDSLPEEKEDEDLYSDRDKAKYSENDFWLRPKKPIPGEEYEGVYRGTKFHINYMKNVWWQAGRSGVKIKARFSNESILDETLELRPLGGSFRITEAKEVLTKVFDEEKGYVSIFVGPLQGDIEIEDFNWEPKGIREGQLWSSPYDGTVFSVNANGDLLIHIGGMKIYALEGHEELATKVLKYKTAGGRFKVNENGNLLTLLYKHPFPDKIKDQLNALRPEEKNLIDIRTKTEGDGMVPIYLGTFKGNIKFKKLFDIHKEWTKEDDEEFLKRIGAW